MGTSLRSCAEVHAEIELSFGVVVSGVTPGIHVLDVGPRASRGRVDFGIVCPIDPMVSTAYFVTEMYSTYTRKVDSISVRTIHHWNLCFTGLKIYSSSRSMLGLRAIGKNVN